MFLILGEIHPTTSDVYTISGRHLVGFIRRRGGFVDFVYVVVSCSLMIDRKIIAFEENGPGMVGRREE